MKASLLKTMQAVPGATDEELYKQEKLVDEMHKNTMKLFAQYGLVGAQNIEKSQSNVYGNCSNPPRIEVEPVLSYREKYKMFNSIWLMENLKFIPI